MISVFGSKERRRRKLLAAPFPPEWRAILQRNVPYFALLSAGEQRELCGAIQVFLAEKRFEGCGGLAIDDEIRVTIAAQACVLLLHRESDYYPGLRTILVYPHGYVAPGARVQPDGTVSEGPQGRLGESWRHGPVVLSWDDVRRGAADAHDGHNVVFHEFAHQLDSESGAEEALRMLGRRSRYIAWARGLAAEYQRLRDDVAHDRPTPLDDYGATNPSEFFAVVTESFFEQPEAMQRLRPELYEELRAFYRQDPAARASDETPS